MHHHLDFMSRRRASVHIFALLLVVLVADTLSARIQPSSAIARKPSGRGNGNLELVADASPAEAASLSADTHDAEHAAAPLSSEPHAGVIDSDPEHEVAAHPSSVEDAARSNVSFTTLQQEMSSALLETNSTHAARAMFSSLRPLGDTSVKMQIILGVTGFILLVFCCTCYLSSYCFGKASGNEEQSDQYKKKAMCRRAKSDAPWTQEKAGPRQEHIHEGRVVYEWDQTQSWICVYMQVPKGLKKSDLDIKMTGHTVQVGRTDKPPFLQERTYGAINRDTAGWRLRSSGELQIYLQKESAEEWPYVFIPCDQEDEADSTGY